MVGAENPKTLLIQSGVKSFLTNSRVFQGLPTIDTGYLQALRRNPSRTIWSLDSNTPLSLGGVDSSNISVFCQSGLDMSGTLL